MIFAGLRHYVFTRLENLCLNGCQAITDHSLKVVADKLGDRCGISLIFLIIDLEIVHLGVLDFCQDMIMRISFFFFAFSLRTFEIFGCFNVSAAAIKRLGQKCPKLETLNLGQCYKVRRMVC